MSNALTTKAPWQLQAGDTIISGANHIIVQEPPTREIFRGKSATVRSGESGWLVKTDRHPNGTYAGNHIRFTVLPPAAAKPEAFQEGAQRDLPDGVSAGAA